MFSSVSGCVPNSRIRLSFVSQKNQTLDITTGVLVYVGISLKIIRPITLLAGDVVEIELDTPPTSLGYEFYEYILDDNKHVFAVVNANDYRPTVKPVDAPRKWFNYFPKEIRTSFYVQSTPISRPMGYSRNFVDIDTTHVVLDHVLERVNFFSSDGKLVTSVYLPTGPVEYKKSSYTDATGDSRVEVFALCNDKKLYRIRFDNQYSESSEFFPTVTFIRSLELLWYESDLPTGESYLDNRRNSLRSKVNPPMTALEVIGNSIWVGGYDTVYVLNKNFETLVTVRIGTESIVSIACLTEDSAYAITREGKIYYVTASGTYTMFYNAARPLGIPATVTSLDEPPFILIPDPNNQQLLKIVGPTPPVLANSWMTPGYAPAYARVFDNEIFVTSHDSNEVLRYTNKTTRQVYAFNEKVTIASWVNYTLLVVHYLKDYVTLDLTGIEKVIPIDLTTLRGPLTQIGSKPLVLTMLGQEGITPRGAPGITCWVNGIKDEPASTGDNFGISYKAIGQGFYRSVFILGDRAYDVDIEVFGNTDYIRSYKAGSVGINRLTTLSNVVTVASPTVGNIQSGSTSLNLGMSFNFFGNVYTKINVSTNGYVTFGNTAPTNVVSNIGGLNVDALYVEPTDLYQGLAITNVNPLNITQIPLSTGELPAVYYEAGYKFGFSYLRLRWAGIGAAPNPIGNTIILGTSIVASVEIPILAVDFTKPTRFDYVSGAGITATTQVVGSYATPTFTFSMYRSLPGNQILVTSYTANVLSVVKYSRISGSALYVLAKTWILKSQVGYRANYLLEVNNQTAIVDGFVDAAVTQDWAIRIPIFGAVPNYMYQTGITSIVSTTSTATCLGTKVDVDDDGLVIVTHLDSMYVSSTDYDAIFKYQSLMGLPVGPIYVTDKNVIGNSYVITTNIPHNLGFGDSFTVVSTAITTSTNMPTLADRVQLARTVEFEYSSLTLSAAPGASSGEVIIQGLFVVVDSPVTINAGATITFKSGMPSPEYNYEVGMYQNSKYQFIEYFYNNTSHSTTSNIGMATGNRLLGKKTLSNTAPAGTSIVYYSEIGSGIFKPLGLGSFEFSYGLDVIAPKFAKGVIANDYSYTVEFYIDQDITTSSNIYMTSTYGLLQLNGSEYSTNNLIKKNDLIQLTTPFNRSLRSIAPIISIGSDQFPVPMIASAAIGTLVEHRFLTANLPRKSIVSITITVPASDYYYIPDQYRSSGGLLQDFQYSIIRSGTVNILLQSGNTYDLFTGDQLTISGIMTSGIVHDTRDIVLIGQTNALIVTAKTQGPALVDNLTFDTLLDPYTNNYYYNFSNISSVYVETFTGYQTANVVLSSNLNIVTANLYIGDVGTEFLVNGVASGNYVTNVGIGSNIAIQRELIDYFQSNVIIYQVEYDTTISSNVFIPIGQWNIENKIITGGEFLKSTNVSYGIQSLHNSASMFDLAVEMIPDTTAPTQFELGEILPLIYQNSSYGTNKITALSEGLAGTYGVFNIASKFVDAASYISATINSKFIVVSSYKVTGVSSAYIGIGSYSYVDSIESTYVTPVSSFTGQIYSDYMYGYSQLGIDSISPIWDILGTFDTSQMYGEKLSNAAEMFSKLLETVPSEFTYATNRIAPGMASLITVLNSKLDEIAESSFSISLIEQLETILEVIGMSEITHSHQSELIDSISYLTGLIQGEASAQTQYMSSIINSDSPKPLSELVSVVASQYEDSYSEMFGRINLDVYKKIQELIFRIGRIKLKLATEFWSSHQTYFEINPTEIISRHALITDILPNEFPLFLDIIANPQYTESSSTVDFLVGLQQWVDVPQFKFNHHRSYDPNYFKNTLALVYVNLLFSEANRVGLLEQPNEMVSDYNPELADTSEWKIPILPIDNPFTVIGVPFDPLRDLPPVYLMPFTPLLDNPPRLLISLDAMLDIIPRHIIPFDPELFQDIIWTMEDSIPEVGAVSTYIHYWADQGQFNDKWNLRDFNSNNYVRDYNPMVMYTKEYSYGYGAFADEGKAEDEKVKYYNAGILQIPGTQFWNYRIYFNNRHFCVPRKGKLFPVTWSIRGG